MFCGGRIFEGKRSHAFMISAILNANFLILFVVLCLIAILAFKKDNLDVISIIKHDKNKADQADEPPVHREEQNL